jgi:hypothetical protein
MRCRQIRSMIEDYHYGELGERQAADVKEHLTECAGCRKELALLEGEAGVYEAYAGRVAGSLEVPHELWERVSRSTASAPGSDNTEAHGADRLLWLRTFLSGHAWVRHAVAAGILVAVSIAGTLLVVQHYRTMETDASRVEDAGPGSSGDMSLEAALRSIHRAEQEYLNAIRMLTSIVDKQKSKLDPKLLAEFQQNLMMIDQHIAATRKAFYEHPRDPDLALYMLSAYSRKVELLQDMTP